MLPAPRRLRRLGLGVGRAFQPAIQPERKDENGCSLNAPKGYNMVATGPNLMNGDNAVNHKPISTAFFVWGYAVSAGFSLLASWSCHVKRDFLSEGRLYSLGYACGSAIAGLLGLVVLLVFIYKVWAAIQDGHARMSAGKAAGFLLIPFFNVYWLFQVIWGFAKDYNKYVDRHEISVSKLFEGLYLAFSVLISTRILYRTIATLQPITGVGSLLGPYSYFLTIPALVLGIIVIHRSCKAVNALPEGLLQTGEASE